MAPSDTLKSSGTVPLALWNNVRLISQRSWESLHSRSIRLGLGLMKGTFRHSKFSLMLIMQHLIFFSN